MLVLLGKSASGKDSIQRELITLGMSSVVSYTTRPPRKGEVDGVAYHFISEYEFAQKQSEGFFAETTYYNVASGETWFYGSAVKDLSDNKVVILNPEGLESIKNNNMLNPVSFYIKTKRNVIWDRLRKRGGNFSEAKRRLLADEKDFENISEKVNYVFSNNGELKLPLLAEMIKYTYDKHIESEVR